MEKYLITLKPLEPYFFGGERTFGFGRGLKTKSPYYIVSENVPSQPTLFGTLRYIILEQNDALWGQENSSMQEDLVGKESFSFESARQNTSQVFGKIRNISPLFLMKQGECFVKTPNDHKPKDKTEKYTPFTMSESSVLFGNGTSLYPTDYISKDGYGGGYVSLEDLKVVPNDVLFQTIVTTGINSHRIDKTREDDKDSFFKKERKMLKKDYVFAFVAEITDDEVIKPKSGIVFMGQNKSPFRYTIERNDDFDLVDKINNAFSKRHAKRNHFWYALSDVVPIKEKFPDDLKCAFYIADTRVIRNLETQTNAKNYHGRLKRSDCLYKIINSGAVFYASDESEISLLTNEYLQKIGMNVFIEIGKE